ncbi:outer membrane beta-barrel protein [Spirosoma fluviale]|uniref:Outer membrane protein beta-barrel domain-containing protein n=1 Tax=Spirosoma fluviale TaxID=1597977 RepID=A0A286F4U3_9BACT|nr:outer membrane beta-barrel protein [Spirosoma fluviale]SOD78250.1 Outer membrane protein beta-barrel domain-containing protein [Spirosoma fluviale]
MRKFFVTLFVVSSFVAKAQTAASDAPVTPAEPAKSSKIEKPFKVNLGVGYASPLDKVGTNDFVKPGLVYSLEPQYELSRNLEVGVRLEQAFIKRSEALDGDIYKNTKVNSMLSAVATANYVLRLKSGFRPYIGVGIGGFYTGESLQTNQVSGTSSVVSYPLPAAVNLGGLGRVGVKYGILNIEGTYNLVSDLSVTNAANRLTLTANNSYFSVKAGLTIGGSR